MKVIYRFGDFEVDDMEFVLRRAGRPIRVEPKVLDLLLVFVRQPGQMLSRGCLSRLLWRDVVVSDSSLGRLVKEVRRVLGDSGKEQKWLETHRCRGFRFIGAVTSDPGSQEGGGRVLEVRRRLRAARAALDEALERGASDLRIPADAFVEACRFAIDTAQPGCQSGCAGPDSAESGDSGREPRGTRAEWTALRFH